MEKAIQKEIKRCSDLLSMYLEIPTGGFGASIIRQAIRRGEQAIESKSEVSMKAALKELKEIEG